jgi:hypothetical protein
MEFLLKICPAEPDSFLFDRKSSFPDSGGRMYRPFSANFAPVRGRGGRRREEKERNTDFFATKEGCQILSLLYN